MIIDTVNEASIDVLAEMIANIQRWLVNLRLSVQLCRFNQELLRLTLRSSNPVSLLALCERWRIFLLKYTVQCESTDKFHDVLIVTAKPNFDSRVY